MADKIAVMNHGVIEQFGTPQEIYDRPATMYRRRLHRLAADEFPARSTAGCAKGATRDRRAGRAGRRARDARGRRRRAKWRSACGPSISASTTRRSCAARSTAPSISARRRSSRSRPPTAWSRRASRPTSRLRTGETVGLALNGARLSLFEQRVRPGDPHQRSMTEAAMADVVLQGVTKRSATTAAVARPRPAYRATASSSCCSARPAPARRRRCG